MNVSTDGDRRRTSIELARRFIAAINDVWNVTAMRELVSDDFSDTRMKSTNLPYRNDYIGRFTVRDDRLTLFAGYLDPTCFVVALGGRVDPPPAWLVTEASS